MEKLKTQPNAFPESFPSLRLRVGLSFVVFVACFCVLQWQLQQARANKAKAEADVAVWTVQQELPSGEALSRKSFEKVWRPASSVDPDVVKSDLDSALEGMTLRSRLVPGAILLQRDLQEEQLQAHLATQVERGLRLYRLSDQSNPFGWSLKDGDSVDVFLETQGQVQLLVESVKVVREELTSFVRRKDRCGAGVQLALNIDALATVLAAEGKGDLRLALRNPDDTEPLSWVKVPKKSAPVKRRAQVTKSRIEHVR